MTEHSVSQNQGNKILLPTLLLLLIAWVLFGLVGDYFSASFYDGETVVLRGSTRGTALMGMCLLMFLCIVVLVSWEKSPLSLKWQLVCAIILFVLASLSYVIGVGMVTREVRIRSVEALEMRRMFTVRMLQASKGGSGSESPDGCPPGLCFSLEKALQEQGVEAPRAKPPPGRPPRPTANQKKNGVTSLACGGREKQAQFR